MKLRRCFSQCLFLFSCLTAHRFQRAADTVFIFFIHTSIAALIINLLICPIYKRYCPAGCGNFDTMEEAIVIVGVPLSRIFIGYGSTKISLPMEYYNGI